jgi:hypothetical protein
MTTRKPGLLTAAAIALGLALSPIASFAAAPRAVGPIAQTDAIQMVQNDAKKKAPAKKTTAKKPAPKKKSAKPA